MKKFLLVCLCILAAFVAATSYGQYDKAWFFWTGRTHLAENRYREAIRVYNALLRVDPDDYEGYLFRGVAKANLDDNLGAEQDFSLAIEKNPVSTMAYHHRAISRMLQGDYDGALEDFDEAIELRPDVAGTYYSRGYALLMKDRPEEAIKDLNRFIFHNNRVSDAYLLRGAAWLGLRDSTKAMDDFDTAVRVNRLSPEAYNRRGGLLMAQGRLGDALADFDTAIARDSSNVYSYFNRAIVHSDMGDWDDALADYNRVADLAPDNAVVYLNRAYVKNRLGDTRGARLDRATGQRKLTEIRRSIPDSLMDFYARDEQNFSRLLAFDTKFTGLNFGRLAGQRENLALLPLFRFRGDEPEQMPARSATTYYVREIDRLSDSIAVDPANPYLYVNRSTMRAGMIEFIASMSSVDRTYNFDDAILDLDTAARLAPQLAYIYYNRASLLAMSGRSAESLADYSRAIALRPSFAEAYYNRGLVQIYLKQTRKGYLDISKAGELGIAAAYELIKNF